MEGNFLYFGDNLAVLRENIESESVDLIYLDPPFNSERDYNVLFKEHGTESEAQIRAFEDWHWDRTAERTYAELTDPDAEKRGVPAKLVSLMESLRSFLGQSDVMAYLVMMAIRIAELRRVLKPTGSLYLHCDPTASHYLKLVLDAVFGPTRFKNEIVWKRSSAHSDTKQGRRQYGRIHDILFFYTKSDEWTWNPQYTLYDEEYVDQFYKFVEPGTDRRYRLGDLTGPGGAAKGNPRYEVMGVARYWRYTKEKMEELISEGRVIQTRPGAVPAYKRYLDEMPGVSLQDLWTDLRPVASQATERLGYPTQKPLALLERIIRASSHEGDLVLDRFCGCGTAIHAAQRLKRRWIGTDITHLAVGLIRNRLATAFPGIEYKVRGLPADVEGARSLAEADPYEFQWWVLSLIGARAAMNGEPGRKEGKKGKDRGMDGIIRFLDKPSAERSKRIIVSVKAGRNLNPSMVRDLRGTIEREDAPIGVLLSMYEPSAEMRAEAARAGLWHSDSWGRDYPRIQLITVEEALSGKRIEYPGRDVTLQAAPTDQREPEILSLTGIRPAPRKKR
jgi:DNA modification methylase